MSFNLRLIAYEPNGARIGPLPDSLSFSVQYPFNDISALTMSYPSDTFVRGNDILSRGLEAGLEVGVEYATNEVWVEPRFSRFILIKRSEDILEFPRKQSLTLPSYGWLLKKARNLKTDGLNSDGKRIFGTATAGQIIKTLVQESQSRGSLPGLTVDFDSALDSARQPWAKVINIFYEPGLDIYTVLSNLTLQGVCDYTFEGRRLRMWNPDTVMGIDRSVGNNPVMLRLARHVSSAPQEESIEDLISTVLIKGDQGLVLTESNPSAPTPWGAWEGYISQGGVSQIATARTLMQADLEKGARVRGSYTRELVLSETTQYPFQSFESGDYILAPGNAGQTERLRVRQITVAKEGDVTQSNLVLNDRIIERELRTSQRITGIVGGSTSAGGSGTTPAPEGDDPRLPAAPTDLVVGTDWYLDDTGLAKASLLPSWTEVTTAENGTSFEIGGYELFGRSNKYGAAFTYLTGVVPDDTSTTYSPVDTGSVWQLKVRAFGLYNGLRGPFSPTVTVEAAKDTTPPPKPSALKAKTRLGTITLSWDGKTAINTDQPRDFEYAIVYQVIGGIGQPIGTLRLTGGQDSIVVTGLAYNDDATFYLIAYDRSDNPSVPSERVTARVTPLVDTDIIGRIIADANIVNVDGTKINPGTIETTRLQVGSGNLIVDPMWTNEALRALRASQSPASFATGQAETGPGYSLIIAPNASRTVWIGVISESVEIVPLPWIDVVPGTKYLITARMRATQTAPIDFVMRYTTPDNATLTNTATYSPTTTWGSYSTVWTAPTGVTKMALGLARTGTPAGNVIVGTMTMRAQVGGVLIENGGVTADKLAANAVTADKIEANAITADKIDAGVVFAVELTVDQVEAKHIKSDALTVKHTITGSTFQTSATSSRGIKVDNSTGFRAYNTGGTATVMIDLNGNARFQGEVRASSYTSQSFVSGFGRYIEIGSNTASNEAFNDEIRFHNGATRRSSIRNPNDNPGRMRFSMIDANGSDTIDFDSYLGVIAKRITLHPNYGAPQLYATGYDLAVQSPAYGGQVFIGTRPGGHAYVGSNNIGMKFLAQGSNPQAQIRYSDDSGYANLKVGEMQYNTVVPGSTVEFKDHVKRLNIDALEAVRKAHIYIWNWRAEDPETGRQTGPSTSVDGVGLIVEELPHVVLRGRTEGYDLGATVGLMWKAIQELDEMITSMQEAQTDGE